MSIPRNLSILADNASSTGVLAVVGGGTGVTTSTGTGSVVLSTSPTLVTPALGTPSALVGTNITGTATAFTASNVTTNANLTGAVTSVGNATSLGSFTSAQLAAALTNETGTGSAVFATSPTLTTPNIDSAQVATVSGTTPLYMARAWVNFNGTGTVAIRGSGNVSSITDNGTGDYTVNFTTAMSDANYAPALAIQRQTSGVAGLSRNVTATSSAYRLLTTDGSGVALDVEYIGVTILR